MQYDQYHLNVIYEGETKPVTEHLTFVQVSAWLRQWLNKELSAVKSFSIRPVISKETAK